AQQTSTSTTYLSAIGVTTSFWVAEVSSLGCEGPRTEVIITVADADDLTVTATDQTACVNQAIDISSSYTPDFNTFATYELTAAGGAGSGVTGTVTLTPNATGSDPY